MRTIPDRPPLSSPDLAQSSGFPARGISFSIVLHVMVTSAFLLLGTVPSFRRVGLRHTIRQAAVSEPLKSLQSPSSSGGTVSGTKERSESREHAVPSRSIAASFVGPQQLVSDPRDPDNSVQTILQPDVITPRRLPYPIAVPSVVKLAMPQASVSLPLSEMRGSLQAVVQAPPPPAWTPPRVHSAVETTAATAVDLLVDAPKLPVLASPVSNYAPQPSAPSAPPTPSPEPPVREAAVQTLPKAPPSRMNSAVPPAQTSLASQEQSRAPARKIAQQSATGKDDRNLLVVNALEIQSVNNDQLIAQNEIHGRFEVAPVALPTPGMGSPGDSKAERRPGSDPTSSGLAGKTPLAGTASSSGHADGKSAAGPAGTTATGSLTAKVQGSGPRGGALGAGPAEAAGSVSPFGAITIQGGNSSAGHSESATQRPANSQPTQHGSYGMTIVSSGSSGGGLRDFGAFRDGPVYTVYLDVSSLGITGTRWSLQYSAAREVRLAHPGALLTPPFPSRQVLPKFPAARVAANLARLFVIQAEISTEGIMESIQILQSPDFTLNALLKECLLKWSFQSASMGADPVAVRVLIGIPIASVMAEASQTVR